MNAERFLRRVSVAGGLLGLTIIAQGCESNEPPPPQVSAVRSSPTPEGDPTPFPTPTARVAYEGTERTSNPQIKPTLNITATVLAQALATATAEETRRQAAQRRPSTPIPAPTLEPTPAARSTVSGSTPTPSR